ncbi:MAG: translation elongation factor Ts [Gemmatimonadales bacterium]
MTTMAITAKDVAELRARTQAGMMDCKKALEEAAGDMEKAAEILRKKGIAKAEKRADRSASQGLVVIEASADRRDAAMIELNCETDFVAKTDDFIKLAGELARHALAHAPEGMHPGSAIDGQPFRGTTVAGAVKEASGKIGEAMALKRVARFRQGAGIVASYLHFTGLVGVLVDLEGPAGEALTVLERQLALHIASADPQPLGVQESDLPADLIATERRIAGEMVAQEGKPENIRAKIVDGKVRKFVADRTLLGQPFVMDDKQSVGDIVKQAAKAAGGPITVKRFARFKVGE